MTTTSTWRSRVGGFRGRVIPEGETAWQDISSPDQIVRYYDPTDVFGDLAEAIADAYPSVSPWPLTPTRKRRRADGGVEGDDDEDDEGDEEAEADEADELDEDEAVTEGDDDDDAAAANDDGRR